MQFELHIYIYIYTYKYSYIILLYQLCIIVNCKNIYRQPSRKYSRCLPLFYIPFRNRNEKCTNAMQVEYFPGENWNKQRFAASYKCLMHFDFFRLKTMVLLYFICVNRNKFCKKDCKAISIEDDPQFTKVVQHFK